MGHLVQLAMPFLGAMYPMGQGWQSLCSLGASWPAEPESETRREGKRAG